MKIQKTEYAHPAGESPTYDMMLACSRCATCLPACPSYSATLLETHSPRGRVQLLRALDEGKLVNTAHLREALTTCLDCRACETVCPNGIHPGSLSTVARGELQVGMPFSRWLKRQALGPMLSNPGILEFELGTVRYFYQWTGLQFLLRSTGLLNIIPALSRMEKFLPRIPSSSVRHSLPEVVPAVGETKGRVGFFLGCAMNTVFADVTRRSISALTRLGYEVVIPQRLVCCAAPQESLGELDLARKMAAHNIKCFDGLDTIVTDCAACGAALKHYDHMLDDASAESFTSRVRDFSEFVEPLVQEKKLEIGPVTYHSPCHLGHAQGVCKQPKALLKRLCPDYRELPEHDRCCGSAGMYWAINPAISDDALARKLQRIRTTGATTVVTANPGCLLQLMGARTKEDTWEVRHVSEIVDQALENAEKNEPQIHGGTES
ncbi:MAG: (Fe-S)-binding protein [Armatimonadota bacterium]